MDCPRVRMPTCRARVRGQASLAFASGFGLVAVVGEMHGGVSKHARKHARKRVRKRARKRVRPACAQLPRTTGPGLCGHNATPYPLDKLHAEILKFKVLRGNLAQNNGRPAPKRLL